MSIEIQYLGGLVSGIAVGSVISVLTRLSKRANRRAAELGVAADALEKHAKAVDLVVDDPALPIEALDVLTFFTEAIADPAVCDDLVSNLMRPSKSGTNAKPPAWYGEMKALRAYRPDLVENFDQAISNGFVAAFLRWEHTAPRFYQAAEMLAAGSKAEAIAAQRITVDRKSRDGDHSSSGAMPALA